MQFCSKNRTPVKDHVYKFYTKMSIQVILEIVSSKHTLAPEILKI